jgi:hypothetical protein
MLTNKIKLIFILTIAALAVQLSGCKKPTYYQLTDQEMTWLVYKNNQVSTFFNGTQQISYLVSIRTKAYIKEGDTHSEFTSAIFEQLAGYFGYSTQIKKGQLYLFKGADGFRVTFSWPHFPLKAMPLTSQIPTAININGINFLDVYVLDGTGLTDAENYIEKVWYSRSQGVIQLQDITGDFWIRDF